MLIITTSHLTPDLLSRYLYPKLAAYKNVDTIDIPRLNLAQRTLLALYIDLMAKPVIYSDRPIYVYISHDRFVVYFNGENDETVESFESIPEGCRNSVDE